MMHAQSILYAFVALLVAGTANAFFVVSGVHAGVNNVTGERPFRQNIQNFKNSGPAWDLYLLSLQKFQLTKSTDPLSWYSIAGVHGRPFLPWDGVNGQNQAGYAMHTSILFGPWHRAYLALFEQIIWNNAQTIAASYPADQRAKYQAAAQTLRIPYWDWASSPGLPSVVTNANIWVNTPTGGKTINNPLYTYKFSPLPTNADFPSAYAISHYKNTVRMPNANGNSQPNQVNAQLLANGAAIRDRTYLLVASQSNYAPFSNQGYTGPLRGGSTDSLENIHNQIHGLTGGVGHMGYIPFSAFDPLFFLHHANVDRLDAIWCAIYPDSYVIPENDQGGTFTQAPNTVEDENTPLTPFHIDQNGGFHTAKTARYPKDFGYSYPEIVDWNVDASQVSANTRAAFKALYDPTSRLRAKARRMRRQAASTPAIATREWSINLKMNKNALGDSYFVHFFLGAPPADAASWSTSSNLVFSQAVLSDLSSTPLMALAQVPLTRSLTATQQGGKIADLESGNVSPFLKENLQWRVQRMDGTVVDPATLTGLSIAVVDQEVTPSGNAKEFNSYGPFNTHPELTWGSQ